MKLMLPGVLRFSCYRLSARDYCVPVACSFESNFAYLLTMILRRAYSNLSFVAVVTLKWSCSTCFVVVKSISLAVMSKLPW